MGEVADADGLTHVQHEHLAAGGHGRGLQHELNSLADGHEVAGHVGVGEGHRPTLLNLADERRYDGPAAPEHIAESHTRVHTILAPRVRRLHEHLCNPLGGAHDAGGGNGLVSGDQHEALHAVDPTRSHNVGGALDVGLHGLFWMILEDRDVLQGGGVEDDLGAHLLERPHHPRRVPDVAQHLLEGRISRLAPGERGFMERRFVTVEGVDDLGIEGEQLADDLRADGATGAGHEHPTAGDQFGHRLQIGGNHRPGQQVSDLQVPDIGAR